MNPMTKPVASVLRVISAGLILLGITLLALLWVAHRKQPEPWWRWALYALPVVAGIVLGARSTALAGRLTRDFEE
jgi:hypothetical protein